LSSHSLGCQTKWSSPQTKEIWLMSWLVVVFLDVGLEAVFCAMNFT
jgi:hypothetical protein